MKHLKLISPADVRLHTELRVEGRVFFDEAICVSVYLRGSYVNILFLQNLVCEAHFAILLWTRHLFGTNAQANPNFDLPCFAPQN